MPASQNKKAISETEIRNSGIANSNAPVQGGASASPQELALALASMQRENERLQKELSAKNSDGSNDIQALANAILSAVKPATPVTQQYDDGVNRTTDFQNKKATVDGQSMLEAQMALQEFRTEPKHPISVSKAIGYYVGANLSVTVNGVRVSIPCDGKTYMINESHYEAIRERLAKLDILNSSTEPQIQTIEA